MKFVLMTCLITFLINMDKKEIPLGNHLNIKDMIGATEFVYHYSNVPEENTFIV